MQFRECHSVEIKLRDWSATYKSSLGKEMPADNVPRSFVGFLVDCTYCGTKVRMAFRSGEAKLTMRLSLVAIQAMASIGVNHSGSGGEVAPGACWAGSGANALSSVRL